MLHLTGDPPRWSPQSRPGIMKKNILAFLVFVRVSVAEQEIAVLSELPLGELLAQKKIVEDGARADGFPVASAVVGPPPSGDVDFQGPHRLPARKAYHDDHDDDDDEGHLHKKKEDHKVHDVLNTSIMVLSYLAFGGYLLCMIATALREKRRRFTMSYPPAAISNQFTHVLQHHLTHRPARPFVRFPTVTVHQGGKKRRRRSAQRGTPRGQAKERPPLLDVIDYVEVLARGGD